MFHILRMIIVGLIVGILARYFYPGAVHLTWLWSIGLGIAGSFVGGLLHRAISPSSANEPIHPAGLVLSIIGAMLLIFIFRGVLHMI